MNIIVSWIKNNPIRTMFLIPIVLVGVISISHVVTWYSLANPINWAIYLSIAIEIGAMTALVAATQRVQGGVWFMFGLVTLIQMIGNIYFCFKEIDETGELFKSWLELSAPIWEMVGTDLNDTIALKRWLAFLEGGLLPIISLTSLHFFVKYDNRERGKENSTIEDTDENMLKEKWKSEIMEELEEKYKTTIEEVNEYMTPGGRHVGENVEVDDNIEVTPNIEDETVKFQGPGIEVKEKDESNIKKETIEIESPISSSVKPNGPEITKIDTATGKVKYKKRIK